VINFQSEQGVQLFQYH